MSKIKRALISVSDKTNLEEFVKGLDKLGVEILSTGGTAKMIEGLGIKVRLVSDYTGFPEMLDGRVKTLHPKIHGALLSLRNNKEHMRQVKEHNIELIDMVVVNLYPFEKTVKKPGVELAEAIENIDIGGPSMLRSASKNYESVAVICNPLRYQSILEELNKNNGELSIETKFILAQEVFEQTSRYDHAISQYLKSLAQNKENTLPDTLNISMQKIQDLRYGENPHQAAAFYIDKNIQEPSVSTAKQLHGKELSFNNIIDLNAALEIVKDFDEPAATIIKHTNPCGTATAGTLAKAYLDALECDRLSAFGSIVGFNRMVDVDTAKAVTSADFVECVIAPGYDEIALAILKQKKNLRLLEVPKLGVARDKQEYDLKKVVGGMLLQGRDLKVVTKSDLKCVTKRQPTAQQLDSMLFGWKICKHVKSNAIVLVQDTRTVGVGAGQMSRVDSVMIAVRKAGIHAKNSVLSSDAFFPKADGVEAAINAGVVAIVQPGGSMRDEEVIRAADAAGICMMFTGFRHFKH